MVGSLTLTSWVTSSSVVEEHRSRHVVTDMLGDGYVGRSVDEVMSETSNQPTDQQGVDSFTKSTLIALNIVTDMSLYISEDLYPNVSYCSP